MMKYAWDGYITQSNFNPQSDLGNPCLTIVDSIDTLYIMNLSEDFEIGHRWLSANQVYTLF